MEPPTSKRRRTHARSRSRSPDINGSSNGVANMSSSSTSSSKPNKDSDRERLERERRDRMARLRAENEEEELKLSAVSDGNVNSENGASGRTGKDYILEVDEEELEGMDEEDQMMKLLGIGGFDSTKGKEVEDNKNSLARGSAAKNKARKYRQYMNRKGGFNRPLDKMN
eukprot:55637_1